MGRELTDQERRELLGAYAIGAVDNNERAQVLELVLKDQDARAELYTLELAVAWLGRSELRPSQDVWNNIAAEIDGDRATVDGASVTALVPRVSRRQRAVALVAAAAAVIGVAFGVSALQVGESRPQSIEAAAATALAQPGARRIELDSAGGHLAATAVVLPDGNGYLMSTTLPRLDANHVYQLWSITSGGSTSAGVLGRSAATHAFSTDRNVSELAITAEPRGGSVAPTGPVLGSGNA